MLLYLQRQPGQSILTILPSMLAEANCKRYKTIYPWVIPRNRQMHNIGWIRTDILTHRKLNIQISALVHLAKLKLMWKNDTGFGLFWRVSCKGTTYIGANRETLFALHVTFHLISWVTKFSYLRIVVSLQSERASSTKLCAKTRSPSLSHIWVAFKEIECHKRIEKKWAMIGIFTSKS